MQLSRLALLLWSAQEITTGANWFRRLLGTAAGAYSLATLKRPSTGTPARTAKAGQGCSRRNTFT
jgi:hypothetical protein